MAKTTNLVQNNMTSSDIRHAAHVISGLLKTACGVANNAAWMSCLEAYDKVKTHPSFRGTVKKSFHRVFDEFHAYERRLIFGGPPYFFRLSDLSPEYRKSFGNITDRDFYDMWAATGATAYGNTQPFVTCLMNKFRIALVENSIQHPEIMAWVITAGTCLRIAYTTYQCAVKNASRATGVLEKDINTLFKPFSLEKVHKMWNNAELELDPNCDFSIDGIVAKNIQTSIEQLEEKWMSPDGLYDTLANTFDEYDEVWRTPGEQKKAISEVMEIKTAVSTCIKEN